MAFDPAYQWAIIAGGPPKTATPGGCAAGNPSNQSFMSINGSGLWLFARKPEDAAATAAMRAKAAELGFDLGVLKPVTQRGCSYPAA